MLSHNYVDIFLISMIVCAALSLQ